MPFKNTVDSILADFNKKIVKLEALADKNGATIAHNEMTKLRLTNESAVLNQERMRAHKVRDKIKELIEV